MTRKATHPLQAKVDGIIEKELGTEVKVGAQISLTCFESIRNTSYVRKRLEQKGFKLMSGYAIRYSYKRQSKEVVKSEKPKPKSYLKKDVMSRLSQNGQITTEGLNLRERKQLITTISYLRRTGVLIESERVWQPKVGFYEMTYKLKSL